MDKPLAIESHVVFKVVHPNLAHCKCMAVQNRMTETLKNLNSQISLFNIEFLIDFRYILDQIFMIDR